MHERKLMGWFDICSNCMVANSFSDQQMIQPPQKNMSPLPQNNDKLLEDAAVTAVIGVFRDIFLNK